MMMLIQHHHCCGDGSAQWDLRADGAPPKVPADCTVGRALMVGSNACLTLDSGRLVSADCSAQQLCGAVVNGSAALAPCSAAAAQGWRLRTEWLDALRKGLAPPAAPAAPSDAWGAAHRHRGPTMIGVPYSCRTMVGVPYSCRAMVGVPYSCRAMVGVPYSCRAMVG
eukprot:gene5500-10290_t